TATHGKTVPFSGSRLAGRVESTCCLPHLPPTCLSIRPTWAWRSAMRPLCAIVLLIVLPRGAAAAGPVPNVKETINRGLTFLAKDNLAWKQKRQCAECHHAPFTIWALNEGKKQGYAVDEKALADLASWVLSKDHLARLVAKPAKRELIELQEAPLLLALGIEAGSTSAAQDGLKKMLTSV